jgi:hypothetical protein
VRALSREQAAATGGPPVGSAGCGLWRSTSERSRTRRWPVSSSSAARLGGGPGISQDEQLREFWQEFFALNVVMACLPHAVVAPTVGAVLDACRSGSARRLRELCGALPGQPRGK